uniref:CCT-beta n=1 Tax=Rhodomonas sp. CCMP768 TaxID=302021 RepID=E8Z787_9CRYP|nr:rho chaperonin-containing TCP-1 [Rhodomonas sp. CCMP768]
MLGQSMNPVRILSQESSEEKGENARLSSFLGAIFITDLMKTTLGPAGMDKILQSISHPDEVNVTNDGATILKSLTVDNPAARVLIDISKTQDDEVGDGTTSVCVFTGELLREGEMLLKQHIHPQTVISGWRKASAAALKRLEEIAEDNSENLEKFREDLENIAKTTLSSKLLHHDKSYFTKLAVDAILRLKGKSNLDAIHIIKKSGGSLRDSFLDEGFILEKRFGVGQPKRLENAKILIANTPMDTDKVKIFGAKLKTSSVEMVADVETAERERMREKCRKIAAHGINCFINRQLIYNLPEEYFTEHGISSIEHADFEGIERLALVLGGDIVSSFNNPKDVKLGTCDVIEEIMIGEDRVLRFSGVALGEACTIVLRGGSSHMLDEAERSLHDALCVVLTTVQEKRVVCGGGCSEIEMAAAVDELAKATAGKEALAMEAYARALRAIPTIIADNGGYDSAELVTKLRAAHASGDLHAGLDMAQGCIGNMKALGVAESFRVEHQVVVSASEAAEMLMRVDDIVKAPPRPRDEGHH